MMGEYSYTTLPTPGHIRLFTLKASKSKFADLHGELMDYPLQECEGDMHCYEALSYVWGDGNKPQHIWIGTRKLHITKSLYTALMRFRNHSADRSLWVDAICIDQTDDEEKSIQVQRMANVYSKASRVIVWLGETSGASDEALYCLADAGAGECFYEASSGSLKAIRKLLARDWFKRIWVLQEVAAAQHVVLMCGATSIDGYAFCVGLQALHRSGKSSDFQDQIGSIVYLIRRSIFRLSKQNRRVSRKASPMFSLNIQPLGQLIDMHRSRKATDPRDKVYALLGMCSEGIPEELLPNYSDAMTWDRLLGILARYVFGVKADVEVVATNIVAVRMRGKVMGHVSSIRPDENRYDMQVLITITSWNTKQHAYNEEEWIIPTPGVSVQPQDIICLLEGGQNIAILRPETEFFRVITTSGRWDAGSLPRDQDQVKTDEYELLLLWDWTPQTETASRFTELASVKTTLIQDTDAIATREMISNVLLSAHLDEKAGSSLLKLERSYQQQPTWDILAKLECSAKIVHICLRTGRWHKAEEFFKDIYQDTKAKIEKKWLSESITQYLKLFPSIGPEKERIWKTLKSALDENLDALKFYIAIHERLAYVFASGTVTDAEFLIDLEEILVHNVAMANVLSTTQDDTITLMLTAAENNVVWAAATNSTEMMELLFEKRGARVLVTENVVVAAVWNGREMMELLFEKRGDQVLVTEDVVVAAARNSREVMELLFEKRADKVPVTERVVTAAAENETDGQRMMELLFEKRADKVPVTERVVAAAAKNDHGPELMQLFFDERGVDVPISEKVFAAAAGAWRGRKVMELLFDKRGAQVTITEDVVMAAAMNFFHGWKVIELLFEKRGDQVPITEDVVKAVIGNEESGRVVMELLLDNKGDQVPITINILRAAAGSGTYGEEIIELLGKKRTLSTAKSPALKSADK